MFEAKLKGQIERIFGIKKVTFDLPGESKEQEGVFIQVETAKTRVKDGKETAHVNGTIHIFAVDAKVPYGFFAKKIDAAESGDKAGLFFFNFEENKGTYRNIVERSVGFQYLFDGQYDPNLGSITSVNLNLSESP
jgi:hypothetical protein